MAAAQNLIVQDPPHKKTLFREALQENGLNMNVPDHYEFVAGGIFAVRAELLRWFQDAEITFSIPNSHVFSTAQMAERALCTEVQNRGLAITGFDAHRFRQKLRSFQLSRKHTKETEALLHDQRVNLDPEFAFFKIEGNLIKRYELIRLPLGDIRRNWFDEEVFRLNETAPYRYIMGDVEAYEEYSEFHISHGLPIMTRERFDKLIQSIEQNGYNEKNMLVVNQNNEIMDGQHRACVLLKMKGEKYAPLVVKIYHWRLL